MGLLDKVRDFFYDDEEDIEEIPKKKKKDIPKEYKEIKKDKWEDKHKKETQEISERELFKAERTFNFPMDIADEDFTEVKEDLNVYVRFMKDWVLTFSSDNIRIYYFIYSILIINWLLQDRTKWYVICFLISYTNYYQLL